MKTPSTPFHIDDEQLSAFLDGELSATESTQLRAALAHEPRLAERLEVLRQVDALVRQQAHALDAMPLPERILARLQAWEDTVPRARIGAWLHAQRQTAYLALAALLVLTVGVGAFWQAWQPLTNTGMSVDLATLLNTTPSGEEARAGDATFLSHFSFQSKDGNWCRQYQWRTSAGSSEHIACHENDAWTLEVSSNPEATLREDAYLPASGSSPVDAALDTLMQGAVLDLNTEATLIANGWEN